jgi:4-amino-4-deoxy-L-arabinose transferase-like glycosyltransferase
MQQDPEPLPAKSLRARLAPTHLGLLGVGLAYLVAQLTLFSWHRAPGWDEAVYLSQVMPGTKAVFFAPSRARGITLLVAPAAKLFGTVGSVRLSLIVISTALLITCFWVWVPVVGAAAPVAAGLFAFSWLGLLNGSEVLPNMWVALLGLATVGLVARRLEGAPTWTAALSAALLALAAVFRPTEATLIAFALCLYIVLFARRSFRLALLLVLGLVIGWLPWIIEMSLRFHGPLTAVRQAATAHFAFASAGHNLVRNLAYTDGRLIEPASNTVPLGGVFWWVWLGALTLVALVRVPGSRRAILLCALAAGGIATEYVVFVQALAPRFLLPFYALAAIPAAVGLIALLRDRAALKIVGAVALILVIPWAVWQAQVANRTERAQAAAYASLQVVGQTIGQLAAGKTCAIISSREYPEIAFAAGCYGEQLRSGGPSIQDLQLLSDAGQHLVFMVTDRPAPPSSPLGHFSPAKVLKPLRRKWYIFTFSS